MSIPPLEQKALQQTDASSSSTPPIGIQQTLQPIKAIAEKNIPKPKSPLEYPYDWQYKDADGNSILHLTAATGTYKEFCAMWRSKPFALILRNRRAEGPDDAAQDRVTRLTNELSWAQTPHVSPSSYATFNHTHIEKIKLDLAEAKQIRLLSTQTNLYY